MKRSFSNFDEFYVFYLSQHTNPICRKLHAYGSFIAFLYLSSVIINKWWWWTLLAPVIGYSFAWIGHIFFEKNKPATFGYPLWSLLADFKMTKEIVWDD